MLITGESGTGKELVARAIHAASDRRRGPLVSLNCPVLSAHLMESELFGHERGAFTGADAPRDRPLRDWPTAARILLDEVTEIDLALQAKLLRVLQEKIFERVGSSETHPRQRPRAGHHQPRLAGGGRGRAIPPGPVLPPGRGAAVRAAAARAPRRHSGADRLFPAAARPSGCSASRAGLDPAARDLLADYHWPGNVRELENIVTRASVLYDGSTDHGRRAAPLAAMRPM